MSALQQIEIRIADRDVPFQASKIHADYYLLDKKSVDDAKSEIQKQRDQAVDKCFLADRDIKVLNKAGYAAVEQLETLAAEFRLMVAKNMSVQGAALPSEETIVRLQTMEFPTWSNFVQEAWNAQRMPEEVQAAIDSRYSGSHAPAEGGKPKKGSKNIDGQMSIRDIPTDEQAEGGPVKTMTIAELEARNEAIRVFAGVDTVEAWEALTPEEQNRFVEDYDASIAAQVPEKMTNGLEAIAERFEETGCGGPLLIGCDDNAPVDVEVRDVTDEPKKLVDMTPGELATACGEDLSKVPVDFPHEDEDWHKLTDAEKIDWLNRAWEEPQRILDVSVTATSSEGQETIADMGKLPDSQESTSFVSSAAVDTECSETDGSSLSESNATDGTVPFAKPAGKNARKPKFGSKRTASTKSRK
ncbi:MAG: hypothetical protein EKK48_12125 [Candidatus Melainabacteria bacterium]|nr:MAG: hypothetical protein EKK48_12125 [Candidatus Melainabacteria bacterium]